MSQSAQQPGSDDDASPVARPKVLSPSEGLPEVKRPDTSFLMQLFVYPLAIVCGIALVVVLVNWVSTSGGNPYDYVDALEGNNRGRWPAAHNLAMELAISDSTIKSDSKLAARLAMILDRELDQTYEKDYAKVESIKLRLYLSLALGEFHVDDGLPALLRAATEQRADDEVAARCTAIGAIAHLAANLRDSDPIESPEVIDALLEASGEDEDTAVLRTAAVALGAVGGPRAIERLKELIAYTYHPSVRYMAATGLARLGDDAATGVLLEMLDLDNEAVTQIDVVNEKGEKLKLDDINKERLKQLQDGARTVAMMNALHAAGQLVQKNATVDRARFIEAIETITAADLRQRLPRDKADAIHDKAAVVLARLKQD
ncbi:MAG: HEAT repeat domain-containing protein [Planctomycetes bacterium]|nr:HEAT repeat domain-containing protein [Planctomycetota bacterium]